MMIYVLGIGILIGLAAGPVADGIQKVARVWRRYQRDKQITYTHWDIHALAREIDPAAWAAFDASQNPKKYYQDSPTGQSFDMAVKALLAGYRAPWPKIFGDEELREHIARRAAQVAAEKANRGGRDD